MTPSAPRAPPKLHAVPDTDRDPATGNVGHQLWTGATAMLAGPRLALQHRDIALGCAAAAAMYVLIWCAVLFAASRYDQAFVLWLAPHDGPAWYEHALAVAVKGSLYGLFWLAVVVAAAPVALPLCAPVLAVLAGRVEQRVANTPPPTMGWRLQAIEALRGAVRGLMVGAVLLAGNAIIWTLCSVLGLLFAPLGVVASAVLAPAWNALGLAALATSFALENRRCRLADQLALLQRRRAVLLGFGLAAQLVAWMPLLMPLVVVAGSALVVRLHRHGHVRYPDDK